MTASGYLVVGVAFDWGKRKGLDIIDQLSRMLPSAYHIVLVGVDDKIKESISDRIYCIPRTKSQKELAEIYTAADVFINPTREDNFPTVNIEALACGTPVITFDIGGSPEMLTDKCGSVIEPEDVEALRSEVIRICEQKPYAPQACREQAEKFDTRNRLAEYVDLYSEIRTYKK